MKKCYRDYAFNLPFHEPTKNNFQWGQRRPSYHCIIGLLNCWIIGLLDCRIVGLSDCRNLDLGSWIIGTWIRQDSFRLTGWKIPILEVII